MTAHLVRSDDLPVGIYGAIVGDLMAYMGRHRISQRSLARTLNVDQATVSRWFNKGMSLADLQRVLDALGLAAKVSWLDAQTGEVTVPIVRPFLAAAPSSGHGMSGSAARRSRHGTQSPLMHSVPLPV